MAALTLKYNGRMVPLDTVRTLKPLTDDDRTKAGEKFPEIDFSRFHTRVEFADKTTKMAEETIDAIQKAGIGLVNLGSDRYVPAANITGAQPFTKEDAARLKGEDYTLSQTFRSRVETKAGVILSSATPQQVMDRRGTAIGEPGTAPAKPTKAKGPA